MGSAKRRLPDMMDSPSKIIIVDHGDGKEKLPALHLGYGEGETGTETER